MIEWWIRWFVIRANLAVARFLMWDADRMVTRIALCDPTHPDVGFYFMRWNEERLRIERLERELENPK